MLKAFSRTIVAAIAASLFLHFSVWTGLDLVDPKIFHLDDHIEVTILDPEEQKQFQREEKSKQTKQIVEQDEKPLNDETPEDTKFLSRHNQTVKKQTRASKSGEFRNTMAGGQNGSDDKTGRPQVQTQKKQRGELPSLKELVPTFQPSAKANRPSDRPSDLGPSQTNDYLKDIEEGPQTVLSTKEFVYYSYYQRIREKIRQYWEPMIRKKVQKIFAQGRTIASSTDRITKVIIVLNRKGSLIRVQVVGESGIRDLDEAAVEAFRAAEPFPNPPAGIVEEDGTIKIRWDFILEASFVNPKDQKELYVAGNP